MAEDTHGDLQLMRDEIDALKVKLVKDHEPWYKSPSILISTIALLFSFGTTFVSYYKAGREEVYASRAELRGILQRLSSLPKDNFELVRKYEDDPEGLALSGLLNQENSLLARQASEIVDRFPNEISSAEYLAVGLALAAASDVEKVPLYFDRALAKTSDPNVKVTVVRNYGYYFMATGQVTEGRRRFEQALSMWSDYPYVVDFKKKMTNALTEMHWSQAEMSINNLEAARVHIRKSRQIVNELPDSPLTAQVFSQILHAQGIVEQFSTTDRE